MARKGVVVLRFDAEEYESLELLAQAMLARATSALTGTVEKATKAASRFFSALRPELSFDLTAEKVKVSISPKSVQTGNSRSLPTLGMTEGIATLREVLHGINAMAK